MLGVTFAVEILLMLGLPVALWFWLHRRWGTAWGLVGAGVLSFIASQVVHLPINAALGLLVGGRGVALWPVPWMALVAGLSAGLCEEGVRYLILRFWKREARSWREGVAFGAGHGGIESMLVGLLALTTVVQMTALRGTDLAALGLSGERLEQVQAQVAAFWATPWYVPLLGALERVFALTIQVALTLMVVRSLVGGNLLWLVGAIVGHALVDAVAVGLARIGWSAVAVDGVVLAFALMAAAAIWAMARSPQTPHEGDVSRETSA